MIGMQQFTIYLLASLLIAVGLTAWLFDAHLTAISSILTQQKRSAWRGFVIFIWTISQAICLVLWADNHALKVSQSVEQAMQQTLIEQQAFQRALEKELRRQQAEWEKLLRSY